MSAIGSKIIEHILSFDGAYEAAISCGVLEDHLIGSSREAYTYIRETKLKGRLPSKFEVADKFDLELSTGVSEDDLPHLVNLVKKRHVLHQMSPVLDGAMVKVGKNDVEGALTDFLSLEPLRAELVKEDAILSFKMSADERLEAYYKAKESLTAIPTMWPSFNKWAGGWCDGTFYVLAGFTTVGKTWSLIVSALDAVKRIGPGENVLIVSTEMTEERIARRLDSVRYKLNFIELRDGTLSDADELAWASAMADEIDSDHGDIVLADSKSVDSVDDIVSLCYRYKPRMVLIDGGYRLRAKNVRGDWERQVRIIEDIQKAVAITNIPWVVTTQLGDANETGKGMKKATSERWNVRYAKEWIINPDYVCALSQNEDLELAMEMNWDFTKMRDAERRTASFKTNWDYKNFNYSEIESTELDF